MPEKRQKRSRVQKSPRGDQEGRPGGHPRRDYAFPPAGRNAPAVELGALGSGRLQEWVQSGCEISFPPAELCPT
eukprot:8336388-Pyramimonas_sp.AAC.2